MGRIFEQRKHKIFARNAKLSKLFTRIGKEIAMAVKAGDPNPEANSSLKVAIQNARGMNMQNAKEKGNEQEEGTQIALELIEKIKTKQGVHGIHIMAVGWEEIVPRIVNEAGLMVSVAA